MSNDPLATAQEADNSHDSPFKNVFESTTVRPIFYIYRDSGEGAGSPGFALVVWNDGTAIYKYNALDRKTPFRAGHININLIKKIFNQIADTGFLDGKVDSYICTFDGRSTRIGLLTDNGFVSREWDEDTSPTTISRKEPDKLFLKFAAAWIQCKILLCRLYPTNSKLLTPADFDGSRYKGVDLYSPRDNKFLAKDILYFDEENKKSSTKDEEGN